MPHMSDVVTLHSLAASLARMEEAFASDKAERRVEIEEIKIIKDMLKKTEEDKAKAKKEREDAEARMWQGLKDGLYATFLSQFTWTHKGGGFCNDTRLKAE